MRALDTNVLVQAGTVTSRFHSTARTLLVELANGRAPWAIPWRCVYEFLRVVTHLQVFHPPLPRALAMRDLRNIRREGHRDSRPYLSSLSERMHRGPGYERVRSYGVAPRLALASARSACRRT